MSPLVTLMTSTGNTVVSIDTHDARDTLDDTFEDLFRAHYDRLVRANIDKDVKLVDEALETLRHIRETWVMLVEKLKKEKADKHNSLQAAGQSDAGQPNTPALADAQIGATLSIQG